MTTFPHSVEREVVICATRATVFRFFTDAARFASWWGKGSHIDPRPGGQVRIVYPNGVVATGEVRELEPDRRIVFTYGYDSPDKPIAPGASLVTITLDEERAGTRVKVRHDVSEEAVRDQHAPGWWFQLALFANAAAAAQHEHVAATIDRWFAAWSTSPSPDAVPLESLVTDDVVFKDAYACLRGPSELVTHLDGLRIHMPGLTITREGPTRQCQGTVVVDWIARGPDGAARGRGTNVFTMAPDGRIAAATGLWSPG
jgi:uncharacterized protein YndB with AHSA1/START domain